MEVKEFSTWPKHRLLFHKITSSGLLFWIKSRQGGAVGLSQEQCSSCDYWIVIERSQVKLIANDINYPVKTVDLLSSGNFVNFWITWQNDKIRIGKGTEAIAVWSNLRKLKELQNITFSVINSDAQINDGYQCEWKCYLPTVIRNLPLKRFTEGKPQWVHANEQLLDGAVIGGYENEFLYIMRAPHRGSLTPGKFVPSLGVGVLTWGGGTHEKNEFEILVGYNYKWVKVYADKIPIGAIEGGYSEDRHEKLYIGRVIMNGQVIPGKVQPSHCCCYIPYENKEISHKSYQILIEGNEESRETLYFYPHKHGVETLRVEQRHLEEDEIEDLQFEGDDGDVEEFEEVLQFH